MMKKNHHKIIIWPNIPDLLGKVANIMIMMKVCKVSQARARASKTVFILPSIFFCTYSILYTFVIIIINSVFINNNRPLQDMMIYYDMMILQEIGK